MRLNHKLISAFIVIAVLISIAGYLGSRELAKISLAYYRETDEQIPALSSLNDMKATLPIIELEPSEYINEPDSEHIEELEEAKEKMNDALLVYERTGGEHRVVEMGGDVDELFALASQIIRLQDEGAPKEVLQREFDMLDDKLDIFADKLDEEKNRISEELRVTGDSLKTEIQYTWDFTVMLAAVAAGIAMAAGIYVSNAVSKPISKLKEAADQIGKGKFDVETNFSKSSDEIGELCIHFERMKEELKNKDVMEKEFMSIASHELRTPIQPILGYVELAKRGLMKQEDAWAGVMKEARRLQKLANDILDVSRIESGRLTYDMQKVNVNEIISEVVKSAQLGKAPNSGTEPVAIETRLDLDLALDLDRGRITQALANIVNNAVKFTKKGRITVETAILENKKLFEIKISDTGTGIPREILPKLFGKFVTKTSGDDVNKHGTGLGLFITKSIVEAHGGDIAAFNNENINGATFVVRLPIK